MFPVILLFYTNAAHDSMYKGIVRTLFILSCKIFVFSFYTGTNFGKILDTNV